MEQSKIHIDQLIRAEANNVNNVRGLEPLPEDGLTPIHINMIMNHTNCSRNMAILSLRETNNDLILAIRKLSH